MKVGLFQRRYARNFSTPISTSLKGMGESGSFQISDQRGKHEPSNKTTEEIRTAIRNHIEPFPKIESDFTERT